MAEVLLRSLLDSAAVDTSVSSAGFLFDGEPATDDAIATMAERGLDLRAHRSRTVTDDMARAADLIVTMTGQHVAEVAAASPASWRRAFPLRDLVRRVDAGSRPEPGESVRGWAERLGAARTARDVLSAPASDDVADPIGQSHAAYQQTAADLDGLLRRLLTILR